MKEENFCNRIVLDKPVMLEKILKTTKYEGPIEFRFYFQDRSDHLYGFGAYFDGELQSKDSDTYDLSDFVEAYDFCNDELVVWIYMVWKQK